MSLLLEARGLTRRYRDQVALDDVSLQLDAGERVAVVGESGSGKSTLARLLLALDTPDAGALSLDGRPVHPGSARSLRWFRRRVQTVPQDPGRSFNPRMRVGEAVAEPLACLQVHGDHTARVAELLVAVGLEPDAARRWPHEFSGGQRQRLAIARALAPRPDVLVADEPVSALDVVVRLQVVELLAQLSAAEGLALVVVSHDLGVVQHLCDRVLVLDAGRVVEQGPVPEVFGRPEHPVTARLLDAVPVLPAVAP